MDRLAAECLTDRLARWTAELDRLDRDRRDAEAVHQARVAGRRLRAAINLFAEQIGEGRARRWRKCVRRAGRALGQVRDSDVQIAFVDRVIDACDDQKLTSGLKRLRLRLTQRRDQQQQHADRALEKLRADETFHAMPAQLSERAGASGLAPGDDPAPPPPGASEASRAAGRAAVERELDTLLALGRYADQPHMAEQLHEMRIAAKRLRYTLEIIAPLYDGRLDTMIKRVARIQQALGDLHDMDIWIAYLPQFVEDERQRHQTFFGHLRGFRRVAQAADYLREHCIGQREKAYAQFIAHWRKAEQKDHWQKLRDKVGP